MIYQYIAYNDKGEMVKGKLQAVGEDAVDDLLSYAGYRAISIRPSIPFLSQERLSVSLFPAKPVEIILFYRELATLLESGVSIVAALKLLRDQVSNATFKVVLGQVIADLRTGNQLWTALAKHPKIFSPVYCRLLAVGEKGGRLEAVLREIANHLEKEQTIAKNIKNALMYPVVTLVIASAVIGLLVTFVLPSLGTLYASLGIELPLLARIMLSVTSVVRSYGLYILLAMLILAGLGLSLLRTPSGRYKWDKLILGLPLLGRINHLSELSRCCQSMALLVQAGLPLTEAVSQVIQSTSNRVMAKAFVDVQQDMLGGEGLSRPMAKNVIFLPMMVHMIRVGEETGNLDTTLLAIARTYEAEAESKMHSATALIQPTMTVALGLIIGAIAMSLTSAIYSIYGGAF
jgi:type IV pilus assembly protein PilC